MWDWPIWLRAASARYHAANSSGWRWRGPCCTSHHCSCSTSQTRGWVKDRPGAPRGRRSSGRARTVVLTTHSLERALTLADGIVVLAAGKVAYEATAAHVDPDRLNQALGGTL